MALLRWSVGTDGACKMVILPFAQRAVLPRALSRLPDDDEGSHRAKREPGSPFGLTTRYFYHTPTYQAMPEYKVFQRSKGHKLVDVIVRGDSRA
jgi:hypothetical protein